MWDNDCFRPDCAPEVRKRSNETWVKIDYGQLHIKIKSMWLRRVYFVLLKFLRARFLVPKRQAVFLEKRRPGLVAVGIQTRTYR
jgi:hypothetical protein